VQFPALAYSSVASNGRQTCLWLPRLKTLATGGDVRRSNQFGNRGECLFLRMPYGLHSHKMIRPGGASYWRPMKIRADTEFASALSMIGACLLLCALIFYYLAVLRLDYQKTKLLDLAPYPDAVEYFAQAKAMLKGGWPSIQIGYDKLPSRYPLGYPVLMLPWLKILSKADSILAPFRTNQTIGLLLLLAVFGFYTYLEMPLTGGVAALILATIPGFFTFCRSSMSDISASALIAFAFMFSYLGLAEERRWKIYLSALLLGLSVNVRIPSVFFAPLLLSMALFPPRPTRVRWFLHCAAVSIVFLLAASPVLLINTIEFHSPFKTGYDFWVPYWSEHLLFSPRYIPSNLDRLWREVVLGPEGYRAANIFGTGTSYVSGFVLLTITGLFLIRINRSLLSCFLAGLTYLSSILSHNSKLVDARYYLPLFVLSVALAALPVTWAVKSVFAGKRIIASLLISVIFVATCFGYPSRSGYNIVRINRSQTWDALHFADHPRRHRRYSFSRAQKFAAQKQFAELVGSRPGIVLSNIDPVYLQALLPDGFVAAPLDGDHNYRFSKIWHYDRPEALALVEQGLDRGLPIYALFISINEMTSQQARLPALPGYEWTILNNSSGIGVLRLTQARAGSHVESYLSPVEH
jgi:hypothetical protein